MKRVVIKAAVDEAAEAMGRTLKLMTYREPDTARRAALQAWNEAVHLCVGIMRRKFIKALKK